MTFNIFAQTKSVIFCACKVDVKFFAFTKKKTPADDFVAMNHSNVHQQAPFVFVNE